MKQELKLDKEITLPDLDNWIAYYWKELQRGEGEIWQSAIDAGFPAEDVKRVTSHDRDELLKTGVAEAGFDATTLAILIAVAPEAAKLTGKIAFDLWKKVILPRLQAEKGADKIEVKRDLIED